ncbi:MAG: beta-hexosaminidase, partial [Pseudomonadota bacterium]
MPDSSTSNAFIAGLSGPALSVSEAAFLREARPWGLILFARNVDTPDRLHGLVSEARSALGWNAPVLIDQEGGRVARLRPPHWRRLPPAAAIGALYARDPEAGLTAAARLGRLIGL